MNNEVGNQSEKPAASMVAEANKEGYKGSENLLLTPERPDTTELEAKHVTGGHKSECPTVHESADDI